MFLRVNYAIRFTTQAVAFVACALAATTLHAQGTSGAISVSPTGVISQVSGTYQWQAVSGTAPNGNTFASYVTGTNPVAYFDVSTGSLMLEPKGRSLSTFDFRWGTFGTTSSTTAGPFVYAPPALPSMPPGLGGTITSFPGRFAWVSSLIGTGTWFTEPWSFGTLAPTVTTLEQMYSTMPGQGFRASSSFAPNLLGYGNGIGMFLWLEAGITGNKYGAVIPVQAVPEPSTLILGACGIACAAWRAWRRKRGYPASIGATSLALVAVVLCTATTAAEVTIDWVTVGDPGNANDPATGEVCGAVDYKYQIGKYEVTIGQYAAFLNAAAKSDPYSLWSASMASVLRIAGISRSGTSGSYTYSVIGPFGTNPAGASGPGNRPITYVSWFDAARFANWMHNGQGSGSTETGAYTLLGQTSGDAVAKNAGAKFYIPTENEWYKAAFYSPVKGGVGSPGYYAYATKSDTTPGNNIGSGANQANCRPSPTRNYSVTQSASFSSNQNYLTDIGAFTNSTSYYGTFDQSGNVLEWNDLTGAAGSSRGLRGGDYDTNAASVSSSFSYTIAPSIDNYGAIGFRLASPVAVPEPSTWVMVAGGLACAGLGTHWRRRKLAGC